jgi:hypothetical protein
MMQGLIQARNMESIYQACIVNGENRNQKIFKELCKVQEELMQCRKIKADIEDENVTVKRKLMELEISNSANADKDNTIKQVYMCIYIYT